MSHPTDAIFAAHAKRLALELECLLMDTKDMATLSRWWDSANQALDDYRRETTAAMVESLGEPHDMTGKSIAEIANISRDLGAAIDSELEQK